MEWNKVVLDWVNCLRLTQNNLTSVSELGDGKFFCEILQLLFRNTADVKNRDEIYTILKNAIQGFYTPSDWIDFGGAFAGNDDELVKIVLVIIGFGSLQSEEKLFIENPSEYLPIETQIKLRKFLVSVLENGKVVDSRFVSENDLNENSESLRPLEKQVNPGIFPFAVADGNIILDGNEISTLKNKIEVLTACQQDLMEDIGSYKNENLKLTKRCEELEKETQSWKLQFNLNNTFEPESPKTDKTPERARNAARNLKERLKRSESYVDVLENRIDEENSKLRKLEEEMTSLKQTLIISSTREAELLKELEREEREKDDLNSIIQNKDETLKKLKQEIDDYKDCQSMNNSGSPIYNTMHASGTMGLSVCESVNNSPNSKSLGMSHCEDMASAVIEVQLGESQELLQASEKAVFETREQLAATIADLEAAKSEISEKVTELRQTQEKLQETEKVVTETREQLKATVAHLEAAKSQISEKEAECLQTSKETQVIKGYENSSTFNSVKGQMKWLGFFAFALFFIVFTPELLPSLVEMVVGRQSMSYIAEKHGRLEHLSIPII